jgi:hypothetical protein
MVRALVTSVLTASALLVVSAAEAKPKRMCDPPHSYTLAANREVRVYAVLLADEGRDVWACYRHTGRRFNLGSFEPHDVDYPYDVMFRLTGRLVGSLASYSDRYGEGDFRVVVRDTKTGAVLHRAHKEGSYTLDPSFPAWYPSRFVMDRAGSVAWTATTDSSDGTRVNYVFKSDTTEWGEQVDAGTDLDPGSLRRHGRMVSWTKGGATRTAQFAR